MPIALELHNLERREPDLPLLATLYRELGFNSLLKELGSETVASTAPASTGPVLKTDYLQFANAAEFRDYLAKIPAEQLVAVWLNVRSRRSRVRRLRHAGRLHRSIAKTRRRPRRVDGRKRRRSGRAAAPAGRSERPKIVHDANLFHLLAGRMANVLHATQIYSYLLRPTTANHIFTDVVMRQFNSMIGGGPEERADFLQRLRQIAPRLAKSSTRRFTKKSICRSLRCLPKWSAPASASIPRNWTPCPAPWKPKCAASKKKFGNWRAWNSRQFAHPTRRGFV